MKNNENRQIKTLLLLMTLFLALSVFLIVYVLSEKRKIADKINEVREESRRTIMTEIAKNKEAVEKGWSRSVEGEVVSVNESQIRIKAASGDSDIDTHYVVLLDKGATVFSKEVLTLVDDGEGGKISLASDERDGATLSDVEVGEFVNILFQERVDVDSAEMLFANEVIVGAAIK